MERHAEILGVLRKEYPVKIALDYSDPMQLLVSTILSAQCTDERVNVVTKELFRKYKTAKDYAQTDQKRLEQEIRSTGFYRNKAKNIINSARMIQKDFQGRVPRTMEGLLTLPGVARKTANIVLTNGFGIVEGIAVDTHVKRLSFRLGLSKNTDPEKIEMDLMTLFPRRDWKMINLTLIWHGRKICIAQKPRCSHCPVERLCPKNGVVKG